MDSARACKAMTQDQVPAKQARKVPVSFPDFCQLSLFLQLFRVVGTVFDCVSLEIKSIFFYERKEPLSHLVTSVLADGTNINIESRTHHLVISVLQHMRRVHRLTLVVVLENISVVENYFIRLN